VENAAEGIIAATEKYDKSAPVNLGSGREVTIKELVNLIAKLTKFEGQIIWDSSRPDGQPRRCLDTTRAKVEFGFKATTCLDEGLSKTID
jgi:GDP-L-fucose synthase